jgi:hypothetical protein
MDLAISSLGIPDGIAGWRQLQQKTPTSFGAFIKDPVLQREISYFEQKAPTITSAKDLLSDYRLQDFVLTAYGLSSQQGMTALMQKVLQSNPTDTKSFAASMVDSRYQAIAKAFNFGGTVTPAVAAKASSAEVAVAGLSNGSGFQTFSGTFAGIKLSNADLTGATTWQGLANTLQSAFRQADGNRKDISVSLDGLYLKFTDAKGRGTTSGISFTPDIANHGSAPTASAPFNLVSGSVAKAASGGVSLSLGSPAFIRQVVGLYTEAQFESVVGNTSNSLQEALYAQKQLPSTTNWYSVIANRPLANVIQTVLGLPQSFAMINVDQQVKTLSSRMNIADFKDPAKLGKLLDRFVAMSQTQAQDPSRSPAVQLLNGIGSSSIINLTMPTTPLPDSLSTNSAVALLQSTALG